MADLKISQLTASTTPLAGTEVLPIVQSGTTKQVSVSNLTAGRTVLASAVGIGVTPATPLDVVADNSTALNLRLRGRALDSIGQMEFWNNAGSTRYAYLSSESTAISLISVGSIPMYFGTNSAYRLSLGATGDVTVNTGNLVIGTSGKGIDFSATSGSGTSELLADYEEGTWTPSLTSAGGNFTTIAYGDQSGTYTKIGRMVKVRGNLFTSGAITTGSASGQVYIAGLPFTAGTSDLGQVWFNPDTANYNMPLALATGSLVISTTLRLFKDGTVNNPAFNVTDLYIVGGPSNNMFFEATYMV